jgi:hypothetical protein
MAKTPSLFDSGVPRDVSEQLARYFIDAQQRAKKIILNPPGTKQSSRQFHRAAASERLVQIDGVLRRLNRDASDWVGEQMPEVYREGIRRAHRQAVEAGVRGDGRGASALEGSFTVIDERALTVLARDTMADLNKAADSMGDRYKSVLRQTAEIGMSAADVNTLLAGGIIDGAPVETARALTKELRAIHGDRVRLIDKNGEARELKVGYYADMVARTKTREAVEAARHERLEELGLDLVAIVGKESDNFCTAFLDQVFSLSGRSEKYPPLSSIPGGGPPFHPNCSKSTRPFVEELATEKQLERGEGIPDARKLLGMDTSRAQKAYKELQIRQQLRK